MTPAKRMAANVRAEAVECCPSRVRNTSSPMHEGQDSTTSPSCNSLPRGGSSRRRHTGAQAPICGQSSPVRRRHGSPGGGSDAGPVRRQNSSKGRIGQGTKHLFHVHSTGPGGNGTPPAIGRRPESGVCGPLVRTAGQLDRLRIQSVAGLEDATVRVGRSRRRAGLRPRLRVLTDDIAAADTPVRLALRRTPSVRMRCLAAATRPAISRQLDPYKMGVHRSAFPPEAQRVTYQPYALATT